MRRAQGNRFQRIISTSLVLWLVGAGGSVLLWLAVEYGPLEALGLVGPSVLLLVVIVVTILAPVALVVGWAALLWLLPSNHARGNGGGIRGTALLAIGREAPARRGGSAGLRSDLVDAGGVLALVLLMLVGAWMRAPSSVPWELGLAPVALAVGRIGWVVTRHGLMNR